MKHYISPQICQSHIKIVSLYCFKILFFIASVTQYAMEKRSRCQGSQVANINVVYRVSLHLILNFFIVIGAFFVKNGDLYCICQHTRIY